MNGTPPPAANASGLATGSMICGILGFLTCGLSGIAGVILGHLALSKMKVVGDAGRGQAIAGLITGYLSIAIMGVAALAGLSAPLIVRQKAAAERTQMIVGMKQWGQAMLEFEAEFGGISSDATAADVAEATGTDLPLTGDAVLNQLLATGLASEPLPATGKMWKGNWYYSPDPSKTGDMLLVSPEIQRQRIVLGRDNAVDLRYDSEPPDVDGLVVIPARPASP